MVRLNLVGSRFREGREDVNDDLRSSSSVSELPDENIQLIRQISNNNRHSTYNKIIAKTSPSLSNDTIK